jgi:hypothetical protein
MPKIWAWNCYKHWTKTTKIDESWQWVRHCYGSSLTKNKWQCWESIGNPGHVHEWKLKIAWQVLAGTRSWISWPRCFPNSVRHFIEVKTYSKHSSIFYFSSVKLKTPFVTIRNCQIHINYIFSFIKYLSFYSFLDNSTSGGSLKCQFSTR